MKKVISLIIPAVLIIVMFACEQKPKTMVDYLKLAAKTGKPVLLDFYTEW